MTSSEPAYFVASSPRTGNPLDRSFRSSAFNFFPWSLRNAGRAAKDFRTAGGQKSKERSTESDDNTGANLMNHTAFSTPTKEYDLSKSKCKAFNFGLFSIRQDSSSQ